MAEPPPSDASYSDATDAAQLKIAGDVKGRQELQRQLQTSLNATLDLQTSLHAADDTQSAAVSSTLTRLTSQGFQLAGRHAAFKLVVLVVPQSRHPRTTYKSPPMHHL
jgi:hypothetical protein